MLKSLRLKDFKNFRDAELPLAPLTVLVGANGSGKSNIRDAFRFLHAIGRGYTLAEAFVEKRGPGGDLVWEGIRGGWAEACRQRGGSFELAMTLDARGTATDGYSIRVLCPTSEPPRVLRESLIFAGAPIMEVEPNGSPGRMQASVAGEAYAPFVLNDGAPALSQLPDDRNFRDLMRDGVPPLQVAFIPGARDSLASWSFLEFDPAALRLPSVPGQTRLGSRGENLSSVLEEIVRTPTGKIDLLEWLQELIPAEATDLAFPRYSQGRVQFALVESSGRMISAESASDGTLRFLGYLAALLTAQPGQLLFVEEVENGIHPLRLHLLVQLLEQVTRERGIQIIVTTHSPALLNFLSAESRKGVSIVYRGEGSDDADICPLMSLPHAQEVIEREGLGRLQESSWMEDAIAFSKSGGGSNGHERAGSS